MTRLSGGSELEVRYADLVVALNVESELPVGEFVFGLGPGLPNFFYRCVNGGLYGNGCFICGFHVLVFYFDEVKIGQHFENGYGRMRQIQGRITIIFKQSLKNSHDLNAV